VPDEWLHGVEGTEVLPLIMSEDPVIRVEAGPGTGKTFGLVRRVQRLLHPAGGNLRGPSVLVVAFNRVIAKQLSDDIAECLRGSPHDGDPNVLTVHALCLEAIGSSLRLLLPHEYEAMVYDILAEYPQLRARYTRFANAEQALRDHEAGHARHSALMHAAERWLIRHHATLISQVPMLLLAKLRSGDPPNQRYEHVIVDEFQDLSQSEHELFVRLRGDSGSLLVLGDPRQSIYAFRGNDRDGLAGLPQLLSAAADPPITDVQMSECRRCPDVIVRAANHLTDLYPSGPMRSTSAVEANIHVVTWTSPGREAAGMAAAIAANHQRYPAQSHLVMVTRRQFGYQLRERLLALAPDLRVDLSFSESLLEGWVAREAFLFFCLLAHPDAPTWRAWLGYRDSPPAESPTPPNRNAGSYLNFLTSSADDITADKVRALSREEANARRGSGGAHLWDRACRFCNLLDDVQWDALTPEETIDEVFRPERWASRPSLQETAFLDLQAIKDKCRSLLREFRLLRSALTDQDQLREVARQVRYQIATREPFVVGDEVDIHVSTLWGAKGVTADNVYILGLVDEAIPGARRDEYPGTDLEFVEEQRRLFYVSLTRSRRTLVLSRFQGSVRRTTALKLGLRVLRGSSDWVSVSPSRFLLDAMDFLPNGIPGPSWPGCAI
jgi:DNA helicase-2/ATP-dependent DNA helicase PcrA